MASVAFLSLRWRMTKPLNFPRSDVMAFPTVLAKQATMLIKVTLGTQKFFIEKSMIHFRNVSFYTTVFFMTLYTKFFGYMETDFRFKHRNITKLVAL